MKPTRRAEIESWLPDWEASGSASSLEISRAFRELLAEVQRLEVEIEDWRRRLATQCGHTLAMRERAAQVCDVASNTVSLGHDYREVASYSRACKVMAKAIRALPEPPALTERLTP